MYNSLSNYLTLSYSNIFHNNTIILKIYKNTVNNSIFVWAKGANNLVLLTLFAIGSYATNIAKNKDQDLEDSDKNIFELGKKWVVLIAGSYGWYNYRHQVSINK